MRIERLGERAFVVRELPCEAFRLARRLNLETHERFLEAVASYETVGLYFDSPVDDFGGVETWVDRCASSVEEEQRTRTVQIPVCYELGIDLESSAKALSMSTEELVRLHLAGSYRCYAVGFSPGFAYLGYLDDRLALPRLASPRKKVDPGSVGITGRQTAVYPSSTPGGWNLIGRCPLTLVDVADDYFPIEAGDEVRFVRISEAEYVRLEGNRL